MGSNRFGNIFCYTSWGESHGEAIGVVIDGCPSGILIDQNLIQQELHLRRPGRSSFVSPRKECDSCQILSGLFEGKTTGAPILILIRNRDCDSSSYESIKSFLRPGHANFTYLKKYGTFDYRGGGRASARETVARVCAGAIAKEILKIYDIDVCGFLYQIQHITSNYLEFSYEEIKKRSRESDVFFPDQSQEDDVKKMIESLTESGDSIGASVKIISKPLPIGLGDPVYEKLHANIAKALFSIPAVKGVFFGSLDDLKGSSYQDPFINHHGDIQLQSNRCGGILGGISCGTPLDITVYFKPTSSIKKGIATTDLDGNACVIGMSETARHDPCVAIRGCFVAEHMVAITLVDAILMRRAHAPFEDLQF